jgi:Cu-processing system permease protein
VEFCWASDLTGEVYNGAFLMSLIIFEEYPLDTFSLIATLFNPIDLSRTLILLKLDISALLGYTGAVFKDFFGTSQGLFLSIITLITWTFFLTFRIAFKAGKKDF